MPEAAKEAYPDAALRAVFASVVVRARLPLDEMLAVLPYRLGDLEGFRLLRTNPDGTAVLTFGPDDTTLPVEQHGGATRRRAAAAGRARAPCAARPDRLRHRPQGQWAAVLPRMHALRDGFQTK